MSETKKAQAQKLIIGGTRDQKTGEPRLVRFAYVNLFKSKGTKQQPDKKQWSVRLMIPKANTEEIAAIRKVIEDQQRQLWWDEKKGKLFLPPKAMNPLIDADTAVQQNGKPYDDQFAGHYLLNVKSYDMPEKANNAPPVVIGTNRDDAGKFLKLGPTDIKSGDWGRASVNFVAYSNGDGGVGVYINSVQRVRKGDPMTTFADADDDFGEFDDMDDADDPLLG